MKDESDAMAIAKGVSMATWTRAYEVGVKGIDEQHQSLFEQIDRLRAAMTRGAGRHSLVKLLDFLGRYVVEHFAQEEGAMRLWHYPGIGEHAEVHRAFRAEFTRQAALVAAASEASLVSLEVHRWLSSWLIDHVLRVDKQTGEFLRAQGAR